VQNSPQLVCDLQAMGHTAVSRPSAHRNPVCSEKIANQMVGLQHLQGESVIVFIDADCMVTAEDVDALVFSIRAGHKVASGYRHITHPKVLAGWSMLAAAAHLGVFGGLFAVDRHWFFNHVGLQFSTAQADDWTVDCVARQVGERVHHTFSRAICTESSSLAFLTRQYRWMRMYRPSMFYWLLFMECLLVPLLPIKLAAIYLASRSIRTTLWSVAAQPIIVAAMLKAAVTSSVRWGNKTIHLRSHKGPIDAAY